MDLERIVETELVQPLIGAIETDDLIATRRLIESVTFESTSTPDKDEVKIYALDYILELRDGEQYKSPPTLADIVEWLAAKGLDGVMDPETVLNAILRDGTTWDRVGGSPALKSVLNPTNIQRVMDLAINDIVTNLKTTQWQLR